MGKTRVGNVSRAFRQLDVDRLNPCEHIVAPAKDLGISRRLLSTWPEQLEPLSGGEGSWT